MLGDIKKRLSNVIDKTKYGLPSNYRIAPGSNTNEEFVSKDPSPPLSEAKDPSNAIDMPKDVSAIELSDDKYLENEEFMQKADIALTKFEVFDTVMEPIIKRVQTRQSIPKKNDIKQPKDSYGSPFINEKINNIATVNNRTHPGVAVNTIRGIGDNLIDKSLKSSDYDIQTVTTKIFQSHDPVNRPNEPQNGLYQTKSLVTQKSDPVPVSKYRPLEAITSRQLITQKARHTHISSIRSIINNYKRPIERRELRNFTFIQTTRPLVDETQAQKKALDAEKMVATLRIELAQKESEIVSLNNVIKSHRSEIDVLKEDLSITKFESVSAISNYRRAAERVDELKTQIDAARLRLQMTSDKLGQLIDYLYRVNNPEHLNVLEDILGTRSRSDLDDIYKKYENLKNKMGEVTDLIYMAKDKALVDKLEALERPK